MMAEAYRLKTRLLPRPPAQGPKDRGVGFALWEIHEAFSAQMLCHIKGLEDKDFVRDKAGVEHTFGTFPRERMNPNGGSVHLVTHSRRPEHVFWVNAARSKGARAKSVFVPTVAWALLPCWKAE